ncbi:hypothetical protein WL77_14650 [Burkholderia ubonensis]|nr:hypothetical protein WL79_28215 [Burkholderia ubonensis]KWE67247.1 hypothetical protein WL77_14650 [Burkholderia ubonensis]
MTEEIRERGFPASKARVERLIRENGIRARHKRRYRVTTDSAKADLFEYIEVFYNRSRRHSSLGLVSPEQFLRDCINAQQTVRFPPYASRGSADQQ